MFQMKLLTVLAVLVCVCYAGETRRLISLSAAHQQWLNESEILQLYEKRIKFIDITDFQELGKSIVAPPNPQPLPTQPEFKEQVALVNSYLDVQRIGATITSLSTFQNRYYNSQFGVQSAAWIYDTIQKLHAQFPAAETTLEYFPHSFLQSSIIATLQGEGQRAAEVVILGAHQDSVVSPNPTTSRSPGADDDASGTATVLEVYRVLLETGYTPDRTVKFIFYAGEEGGLLGSQAIAQNFATRNVDVYAALQLDMTGYSGSNIFQPLGIITDYTNANLTQFIRILVDAYSLLTYANSVCGYGCSDHASWNRTGYRAAFPFETVFNAANPYVHTGQDTLDKLDPRRVFEFAKIGTGFVIELAGQVFNTDRVMKTVHGTPVVSF